MPGVLQNTQTTQNAPDGQPENYYTYEQGNEYTYDPGLLVLPVAGPDGSLPRVIKIHAAIGSRSIVTNAVKVDTPPIMPSLGVNTSEGDIFLSGVLSVPLPQINSNQNGFNYFANFQATYLQPGPPRGYTDIDCFQTGNYPFALPIIDAMAQYVLTAATINSTGDPDVTTLTSDQIPPSTNGQGTQDDDWQWLSTTFLPDFFLGYRTPPEDVT